MTHLHRKQHYFGCDELSASVGTSEIVHRIEIPDFGEGGKRQAITLCVANTESERNSANMLINRMYSWRGYGANHQVSANDHSTTFTASSEGRVIGTLTLAVDSEAGLALDGTFPQEMAEFRSRPGAKICELTKFAFDTEAPSKPLLAALFHIIFIYGSHRHRCTDLFIEVNPRHCRFYEAMLGFKRVGSLKTNAAVNAPSQLLWLKVSDIRRNIDDHCAQAVKDKRSLYPYFFSADEEIAIYTRLLGHPANDLRPPEKELPASVDGFLACEFEAPASDVRSALAMGA